MTAEQTWDRLSSDYLRRVEQALARVDHPGSKRFCRTYGSICGRASQTSPLKNGRRRALRVQ